ARARRRRDEGPELHACDRRPGTLRPPLVPTRGADEGADESRGARRGAFGGGTSREPGGVLPRGGRLPRLSLTLGACGGGGRDRRRVGPDARHARRLLAVHARPATRAARRRRERAALRARDE